VASANIILLPDVASTMECNIPLALYKTASNWGNQCPRDEEEDTKFSSKSYTGGQPLTSKTLYL